MRSAPLLALVLCAGAACDVNFVGPDPTADLFHVSACDGERFTIRVTDPRTASRAQDLIGIVDPPVLTGALVAGNGGFNQPWSWHLDPATVEFVEVTAAICDGCPSGVQQNLDDWLHTVGRFCPWTARVVERAGG